MATIHTAARDGNLLEVAAHVRTDPRAVKHTDSLKRTPLHWAALHGHKVVVEWLLAHDANPDARDGEGYTPLGLAAHGARLDARRTADRTAAAASSWPYPQVWRWPLGRVMRGGLFLAFLLVACIGLALVRPGAFGSGWNTVEVVSEPRLILDDYAGKPLKAMAGSGSTLAFLTEDGDVYLLNTETRLSRTLCKGIADITSDDTGTLWLLRTDGGIDRAEPTLVGGFTVTAWQAPPEAERYWKTGSGGAAELLANDLGDDGWLVAVKNAGVARYRMNADGSRRRRSWQTSDLSDYRAGGAVVVPSGVWLTGANGGVRFADRATLQPVPGRQLNGAKMRSFHAGIAEPWASGVDDLERLWLHPATDTGWVGPLFAPGNRDDGPNAVGTDDVSVARLHGGTLYLGTTSKGLFKYQRSSRQLVSVGEGNVRHLMPVATGGVVSAGSGGLKFVPADAKSPTDASVLDNESVDSADGDGSVCLYATNPGGRGLVVKAVLNPAPGAEPLLVGPNSGWRQTDRAPSVVGIESVSGATLVFTDAGAFRYDPVKREYADVSSSPEGPLPGFRHVHESSAGLVAVTTGGNVYRFDPERANGQFWKLIDMENPAAIQAAAGRDGTVFAATRNGLTGVANGKVFRIGQRLHSATPALENTQPVADLHTPADGDYVLGLVVEAERVKANVPVYWYHAGTGKTARHLTPLPEGVRAKQIRWYGKGAFYVLRSDGVVTDQDGAAVFGDGGSPVRPADATAVARIDADRLLVGGTAGRIARYDWPRGRWDDLPAFPGAPRIDDVAHLADTTFARTAGGVFVLADKGNWATVPFAHRWLLWPDPLQPTGMFVGPTGVRKFAGAANPELKPTWADATGVRDFLRRARHVWQPSPDRWVAFTDTAEVGDYDLREDTFTVRRFSQFKRLAAVVPNGTEGVLLLTDDGLFRWNSDLTLTRLSTIITDANGTAAIVNGRPAAAALHGSLLRVNRWTTDAKPAVETFTRETKSDIAPPDNVVAAAPSVDGLFLLLDDGTVVRYAPDTGRWSRVDSPADGEKFVGWLDAERLTVVTWAERKYRLAQFDIEGRKSILFETELPPEKWTDAIRAQLPPLIRPKANWFERRRQAADPMRGRPAAGAVAMGLLKGLRGWQADALQAPPKIRTNGAPFGWVRGAGVDVMRDAGGCKYRLNDGTVTRPLTRTPSGFAEDDFAGGGLGAGGEVWATQSEPRQLVRLQPRNGGLSNDLTVPPIELPDHLERLVAPDGRLEFRDRHRPGLYWTVANNRLQSNPNRHQSPLPTIPFGNAALAFERVGFDGVRSGVEAKLIVDGRPQPAWDAVTDRPVWIGAHDCAKAGNSVLFATSVGIVERDRDTFAVKRIVPTSAPAAFVREPNGELLRLDIGTDSYQWNAGPNLLAMVPRAEVALEVANGPWQWRVKHLTPDARRVDGIRNAAQKERGEAELPGQRWAFPDDRVNWIGRAADGGEWTFATDNGVWPAKIDTEKIVGRTAEVKRPGTRAAMLRCPVGPTWAVSDGTNWTPINRDFTPAPPGTAVVPNEAALANHPAWSATHRDGELTLLPADGADKPAFVKGQPFFERADGIAGQGGRVYVLSAGRGIAERDPFAPERVVGYRPLPPEVAVGWKHQLETIRGAVHLVARHPDPERWKLWSLDAAGGGWNATADPDEARVIADTGAFRWRRTEPGEPLTPTLNPKFAGGGPWNEQPPVGAWWWSSDRFAWDVVTSAALLDDRTALFVTPVGPTAVAFHTGVPVAGRVWLGGGFLGAFAGRTPDGKRAGVFVRRENDKAGVFFGVNGQPGPVPVGAAARTADVSVTPVGDAIDFAEAWVDAPTGKLKSDLPEAILPPGELLKGGQFAFDRASAACPLPGPGRRWVTAAPGGLVAVFQLPEAADGPVRLLQLHRSASANVIAVRPNGPNAVFLYDGGVIEPLSLDGKPVPINDPGDVFRNGDRVSFEPSKLLFTRTPRYITRDEGAYRGDRDPFVAVNNSGLALACDVMSGIAVRRGPAGLELSLLTRGGVVQTSDLSDGETALSFPKVRVIDPVNRDGGDGRVRFGPTGELWMQAGNGPPAKRVGTDWQVSSRGWIPEPWPVAGRQVSFPDAGGVAVNGVRVERSNNSWRLWQRPFGRVIDTHRDGDVIWACTRENGVFKIHPDRLVPGN